MHWGLHTTVSASVGSLEHRKSQKGGRPGIRALFSSKEIVQGAAGWLSS